MSKAIARFLPIVVGVALGVLIVSPPAWLRTLGPVAYLVTGSLALVALVAFVAVLIAVNLPAEVRLTPQTGPPPAELAGLVARYAALGFVPAGPPMEVGISPPGVMVAFVHERERAYGTIFRTNTVPAKVAFDFVSLLEGGHGGLTSSAEVAGATLPADPGDLRQVVPGATVEQVFERHRAAVAWLATRGLACRAVCAGRFVDDFRSAIADQRRSVLANPLKSAVIAIWRSATRTTPHLGPLEQQKLAARQIAALTRPPTRS